MYQHSFYVDQFIYLFDYLLRLKNLFLSFVFCFVLQFFMFCFDIMVRFLTPLTTDKYSALVLFAGSVSVHFLLRFLSGRIQKTHQFFAGSLWSASHCPYAFIDNLVQKRLFIYIFRVNYQQLLEQLAVARYYYSLFN